MSNYEQEHIRNQRIEKRKAAHSQRRLDEQLQHNERISNILLILAIVAFLLVAFVVGTILIIGA